MWFQKCITIITMILMLVPSLLSEYHIGVGIADCTGPSAEIVFMGYAKFKQKGCGVHLRQFSRAFIFDDGRKRALFVSADAAMIGHGVRRSVLHQLNKLYNDTYNEQNFILSATHTHSTPAGFMMDLLYSITNFGFIKETFDALVNGVVRSIRRAHENMVKGRIYLTSGELLHANINRSPTAYLLNPPEERSRYSYDVDKEMVQLKLVRSSDNKVIGAINWFAVHPTSMNNTNCLVSSDNVGYASILLEKMMNRDSLLGKGSFVGAFASTNLGDVSPNLKGPHCIDTGNVCDLDSSTCNGQSQNCIASGPGDTMFESTRIIAERLFKKAKELLERDSTNEITTGPVKFIHQYVDMTKQVINYTFPNGTKHEARGCQPAMGYSFAAGTTDGPGEFDFKQATLTTNPMWNTIRDFIFPPTKEDISCQHPKPILINTGRVSGPYQWQPKIVALQVVQLGKVILTAVPGEFTTMSGRRLRNVVKEVAVNNGGSPDTTPIITGLSNIYSSYITTPEEYQKQRYEGASTIYGPHTLTIYLQLYKQLTEACLRYEHQLDPGPAPPDFSSQLISLVPPVIFDTAGILRKFGDCTLQPDSTVKRGKEVIAKFISGHPRNNLMQEKSFLYVERHINSEWTIIATDADWDTKFIWKRTSSILGGSEAIIHWKVPMNCPKGTYRIRHNGHYKHVFGGIRPYEGITRSFQVV